VGFGQCLLAASAPALFWLWLFYRRDRFEPEPKREVLKLYVLGALAAVPAYFAEAWMPGPGDGPYDLLVRVALVEESAKFLPVWWFAYRRAHFNEPMDGIVYGAAAALGFATAENAYHAFLLGPAVLLPRAFTATLVHLGLTGIVGAALGVAKFRARGRAWIVLRALAAAVLLHGAYDAALQPGAPESAARWTIACLTPALLVALWFACRRAPAASPFRNGRGAAGTPVP
jgi:RsiW-degrading membrane proteinase PrsW (M82 family)